MSTETLEKIVNIQTGKELDWNRVEELKDNAMLKVKPELFIEWDFKKNDELGLDIWVISKGSHKKVWWICSKCKSNYDLPTKDRVKGSNCPYCAGKRVNHTNSLASIRPDLVAEWHPTKNGDLTPNDFTKGNRTIIWWVCSKCKCDYDMDIKSKYKSKSNICPYCTGKRVNNSNSLAKNYPEIAKDWHPTKNGDLTPQDFTYASHQRVWWLGKCGHEWNTPIKSRTLSNSNCHYCSGRKALKGFNDMWTTNPNLASLLLNPEDGYKYSQSSHFKVDWKCKDCNSIIKNKSITNTQSNGLYCPVCDDGKSYPEKVMYNILTSLSISFIPQKSFHWSDKRIYDFYLPDYKTIIEVHGKQHYDGGFESVGGRSLIQEQVNDRYKHLVAMNNGIENYIVIDCRYSKIEWIKNSIMNSSLHKLFDLRNLDWKSIHLNSSNSNHILFLELWNQGLSVKEISEKTDSSTSSIWRALKKFRESGIYVYDKKINNI